MADTLRDRMLRLWAARRKEVMAVLEERARIREQGKEPYDKEVAHEAVRQFLEGRVDNGAFAQKLSRLLREQGDRPLDDPPVSPKGRRRMH